MKSMKKITVEYKKGYYAKYRSLKLFVDNQHLIDIKQGQKISLEIEENAKEIYGKMDWGKTKVLSISNLNSGDTILITPNFTLNPLRSGGIIFSIPIKLEII